MRGGGGGGGGARGGGVSASASQTSSHAQGAVHGLNGFCSVGGGGKRGKCGYVLEQEDKTDWSKRMNPRARRVIGIVVICVCMIFALVLLLTMCTASVTSPIDEAFVAPIERIDRGAKEAFEVEGAEQPNLNQSDTP